MSIIDKTQRARSARKNAEPSVSQRIASAIREKRLRAHAVAAGQIALSLTLLRKKILDDPMCAAAAAARVPIASAPEELGSILCVAELLAVQIAATLTALTELEVVPFKPAGTQKL